MIYVRYLFLAALFWTQIAIAQDERKIQYHSSGTLRLEKCETNIDCTFSGEQILSGQYEFGEDELCEDLEIECIALTFYPREIEILPHFKGYVPSSISIINVKEIAPLLVGKDAFEKIMKHKIKNVSGKATIVLHKFAMGISCDHAYAGGAIKAIKSKSKPHIKGNASGGC